MNDIIWYLSFSLWLISLSMIISRFIYVAQKVLFHSFLWLNGIAFYMCNTSSLSICQCAFRLLLHLGFSIVQASLCLFYFKKNASAVLPLGILTIGFWFSIKIFFFSNFVINVCWFYIENIYSSSWADHKFFLLIFYCGELEF